MQPYGGIGTANVLGMSLDDMVKMLGSTTEGKDFFDQAQDAARDQFEKRQIELTALAQDIYHTFNTPHGQNVLMWMIEKTLLNPTLPITFGKSFDELAPWRAMREGENAFVFQLVTAIYQHRMANGATI